MIYLDQWKTNIYNRSNPIDIPSNKRVEKIQLQSNSGDIIVIPNSFIKENKELIVGIVDNTPPKTKHYKKGDKVMFHKDNVINMLCSSY